MAAGNFTITDTSRNVSGCHNGISGTAEIDGTMRAFDILPSSTIVSFRINGYDEAGQVTVRPNETATKGTADNGSVGLQSSTRNVNTYNWTAVFI